MGQTTGKKSISLDPVDYLPNDMLWKIFGFLSVEDLCHLAVCSKAWRNVTNTNILWLHNCKLRDWERFGTEVDLRKDKPIHSTETINSGASPTFQVDLVITGDCNLKDLAPTCEWKEVYMRAWHLDRNWSEGRYWVHRLALPELSAVKTNCVSSDGRTFVAGEELGFVRLWDLNSGSLLRKIQTSGLITSPYQGVRKMVLKNNIGFAAFMGGVLVFEASTGKVLKLIRPGHDNDFDRYTPSGLYMEEDKVIVSYSLQSGRESEGVPVHIWDISGSVERGDVACTETKLCTDSLNVSMRREMECFACQGHWVITSFEDETAFILWDTRTSQHVRIYKGHSAEVRCGHLDEDTIMTGDSDGEIKVWTTDSDFCLKTLSTKHPEYSNFTCKFLLFNDKGIAAFFKPRRWACEENFGFLVFWSRDGTPLNKYGSTVKDYKVHGDRLVILHALDNLQVSVLEVSTGKCLLIREFDGKRDNTLHMDDTKIVLKFEDGDVVILQYW
ncbi:probable E3 ubiquitin ligase complex SCF subunit sconB [Patiria miniata]|uniref:F-box domain-containing protein n=1 Tax=Patiria miniata TaxID=46514 RepID=A0A914BU67_PATMI|nr:probable E3 ubiquitin ligase complex SCF subunit sconB [Patiria miniata]